MIADKYQMLNTVQETANYIGLQSLGGFFDQ
jgi:hypothetical protein